MTEAAEFNGKTYLTRDIAEHQRKVFVNVTALRMMQKHYGNPYFSFKGMKDAEIAEWTRKADEATPLVCDIAEAAP